MALKKLPDQTYLRERLNYDPATGILTWRERPPNQLGNDWRRWNSRYAGTVAGGLRTDETGYQSYSVTIDGSSYKAHRLIWKWTTGEDPADEIDHINRDATDNRWDNFRSTTSQGNAHNTRGRRRKDANRHLPQGVFPDRNAYHAVITVNYKRVYLGRFRTPEAAHEVYVAAKSRFHKYPFAP